MLILKEDKNREAIAMEGPSGSEALINLIPGLLRPQDTSFP